jgi:hypothetical protein
MLSPIPTWRCSRRFSIPTSLCVLILALQMACGPTTGNGDVANGTHDACTHLDAGEDHSDFVLGFHPAGAMTPSQFSPLAEGSELEVVLGLQGLWMVVLSFKTCGFFNGPIDILGRVEVDGQSLGQLGLNEQTLVPEEDGFDYFYNFFLVVSLPHLAKGPGTVVFHAEDGIGNAVDKEVSVRLIGGS